MSPIPPPPGAQPHRPSLERVAQRLRSSVAHGVLPLMADAWSPHVMLSLWLGKTRFDELIEGLKISRTPLSQRLQWLQDQACLSKTGTGHPAYQLTPRGQDFLKVVMLNRQWNEQWKQPQRCYPDLRIAHECGAPLNMAVLCRCCHQEVVSHEVKVLDWPGAGQSEPWPEPPSYRRARRHTTSASAGGSFPAEDISGDRWIALIIASAFMGLRRNSEFEQAIGIAPNILATRLNLLVDHGFFDRVLYQTAPERYEYRLTPKGLARYPLVLAMMEWGKQWLQDQQQPARWHMLHMPCCEWLEPELVCRDCGETFQMDRLRVTSQP